MNDDLKGMTDWAKLGKLLEENEKKEQLKIDQLEFENSCYRRVKGQNEIVKDVVKLIRMEFAKAKRNRPIANLLFLGPTGTGKTELAKSIAEYLYGDEKNMIRFDCSELSGSHSKDRLIGIPTGYVGAESGGQLTRPILQNPRRVILFDEIEKAYSGIFDLFLQLMGDGRLTEQGSGKVADFTQSVIILTSNALADDMVRIKMENHDPYDQVNALKSHLADTQVFRPEIMGRIDRVHIFNPLQGQVLAEISLLKLQKLAKEYGLALSYIAPETLFEILEKNKKVSRFGVRELERILFDHFADHFINLRNSGNKKCQIVIEKDEFVVKAA